MLGARSGAGAKSKSSSSSDSERFNNEVVFPEIYSFR